MAAQTPSDNTLTEAQGKTLAKLSSLTSVLKTKPISNPTAQISSFDYLKKITQSTLGAAAFDSFLLSFINKLFDVNSDKFEKIVLNSLAVALNKNGKTLSNNGTNQQYLYSNVLPSFSNTMRSSGKSEIVKLIISLIFGPKNSISQSTTPMPDHEQEALLNAAVCAGDMFSTSNPAQQDVGSLSYNKVQLEKQLRAGQVTITVSCQDIKISMSPAIFSQADSIIINNSSLNKPPINPAIVFSQVNNLVNTETQRINSQENSNAIAKSFNETLINQIISLSTIAIAKYLPAIMQQVNNSPNGHTGFDETSINPTPCAVSALSQSGNDANFKQQTAFVHALMNALYAMLLSIILEGLIREIKKLIKKYISKRASDRLKRQQQALKFANISSTQGLEKVASSAKDLQAFNQIFHYNNLV